MTGHRPDPFVLLFAHSRTDYGPPLGGELAQAAHATQPTQYLSMLACSTFELNERFNEAVGATD